MWSYLALLQATPAGDFPASPALCDEIRTPVAEPIPADAPASWAAIRVIVDVTATTWDYLAGGVLFARAFSPAAV